MIFIPCGLNFFLVSHLIFINRQSFHFLSSKMCQLLSILLISQKLRKLISKVLKLRIFSPFIELNFSVSIYKMSMLNTFVDLNLEKKREPKMKGLGKYLQKTLFAFISLLHKQWSGSMRDYERILSQNLLKMVKESMGILPVAILCLKFTLKALFT